MMMLDGISAHCQRLIFDLHTEMLTKQDIWNEEDRACNVVLVAGQADIFVHAFDLRIADVASIDVAEEVEDTEHTDEPEVDLR
jgi:hypothetical protein